MARQTVTQQNDRPVKVYVIDQKDEAAKKQKAASLARFSMKVRTCGLENISRIIMAKHDSNISDVFSLPLRDMDSYALIEIFGDKSSDPNKFKLEIKKAKGILAANKIQCVAFKDYYKENPTCKFVCKID